MTVRCIQYMYVTAVFLHMPEPICPSDSTSSLSRAPSNHDTRQRPWAGNLGPGGQVGIKATSSILLRAPSQKVFVGTFKAFKGKNVSKTRKITMRSFESLRRMSTSKSRMT